MTTERDSQTDAAVHGLPALLSPPKVLFEREQVQRGNAAAGLLTARTASPERW